MLKQFVESIIANASQATIQKLNCGKQLVLKPSGDTQMLPCLEPTVDALRLHSLTGLVDYINEGADGYVAGGGMKVVVESPFRVVLASPLFGDFKQREFPALAVAKTVEHHFGDLMSQEQMIVWLNTGFLPTDNRTALLQVVSSLRDESMSESTDDGISQTVAARVGTSRMANITIPNPILLVPTRTFHEVEQVETPFLLRIKGKNDLRLREADGGAWEMTAMQRIKDFLVGKLPESVKVLA